VRVLRWRWDRETNQRVWGEVDMPGVGDGYVPPPPPRQPAIPVDVEHPSIPKSIKTAVSAAQAGGWNHDLRRAVSPDGVHMVALRAGKPGRRIALVWAFAAGHWTKATKAHESRWKEAEWVNQGAWIRSVGQHSQVTHTDAVKELRRG
jgi:hypothetical protein